MSKSMILKEHLEFKKISVKSKSKLQDIERYLKMFLGSSKKSLDKFNDQDIVKFLNSLNYSIRTVNGIKAYLKAFIKWKYEDWSSRFRNLDKICKTQQPPKAYTPDQMISYEDFEKIVKAETNLSWKVYWLVMFYGGFRPSEACRLKWDQIFFESEGVIIKLRTTKTSKDFMKSLPKEAEHKLKELKQNTTSELVFPSPLKDNQSIGARTVCARLKRVSKKALGKEVVPYQLRHSIATILYGDSSKKDDDIAQQLGHAKNMREVYKNLDGEQIKKKARSLWGKPLTPEETDKIKKLESELNQMKEAIQKQAKMREEFFDMIQNEDTPEKTIKILETLKKKR